MNWKCNDVSLLPVRPLPDICLLLLIGWLSVGCSLLGLVVVASVCLCLVVARVVLSKTEIV